MQIIFINGISRAGKDTFVEYCSKYKNVSLISTVDAVKVICRSVFDWDGNKDAKGRALLSSIREVWAKYNDGPVNTIRKHIDEIKDNDVDLLFIMVREFSEMKRMQELFGGSTLNVIRKGLPICETEQAFLDMVPPNYSYDLQIINNGTLDDLDKTAQDFCSLF